MKLERFFFGLIDDKVTMLKTEGVSRLLYDKSIQRLRQFTVEDSGKYFWFPTEQVIAIPHVKAVEDSHGRTFVRNLTLLISIHDYLKLTQPQKVLDAYGLTFDERKEMLETLEI